MNQTFKATLAFLLVTAFSFTANAADWIHLPAKEGTSKGKKIVFVTGDDEYKSETSMPMMAHILAEHHGFDCTVLFAINRKTGVIDTNQRDHIPGLEALKDADLMVIYTRFRALVDEEMQMIQDYLDSGRPVIGIRTSTHAFDFSKNPESPFAKFSYSNTSDDYTGGFGQQVLGQNWINHWGGHGRQATRGRFAPGRADHPILRGIVDGEIWGPTDVYEATQPQQEGCEAILLGEVSESMEPDSGPAPAPPAGAKGRQAINKNDPMMPVAWTYRRPVGAKGRVFASTIGGAMSGKDDWANEGMRRMFVNACFWTLQMASKIPAKANVTPILDPNPFKRGIKPEQALRDGLAKLAAKNSTILFYGNSMIERLLEHGELEARLQIAQPKAGLKIRSLAWTGDEVGNRLRLEGYAKHMKNLLAEWPANTIVLGYGLNESFAGEKGLADFHQQYTAHLNQLGRTHPGAHIVMLSPIAVEGATEQRQAAVELYSKAIAKLASEHKASFVDLFALTRQAYASSDKKLTTNGIHLNESGNQFVAKKLAKALAPSGSDTVNIDPKHLHEVALAASAKHRRVAEVVRVKNGVVYFGVRARPAEYAAEMPRYHEMIRLTDAVVHQLAADPKKTFASIPAPSLPPMPEGRGRDDGNKTGIIKTVAQNQAEFKTAEGYEVSLFASEEEFPELRNPVQIAFDARGRLWVVTMPSFPHTVPGLTPPDKIIILEDTDGDGKADKLTPYLEGLDALDGITFHHDGVIISEQPRLWLTQDSNGDDRADNQSELLRGIDVTDSHHGGMIQSDPLGALIFSDGVFHRSQFETKFGVHRAMDASTYRLDIQTGGIITEWQHTTPNPWNVTFDRWGNIFQMYGDGDVYDGTSLIWTPFGAYHPYAYARMTSYGKGSGCAMISSPNFPDEYQNGIASASLLGRYAITLTKLDRSGGMVKRKDSLTILESPNAAFRPADIEFAMDGSLYISDFCSPIIGHAQHPMRDPHWDHDYGRIWRVVHTKKPLQKEQPQIEGASVTDLCALLTHPQDLVRHHARIELRKHGAKGLQALDQWIASFDQSDPNYDQAVLEALFVCEGLSETRPALLNHLLKSKSELYRGAAVHIIRIQADRLPKVKELLASVINDPHPRVQVEVIDAVAHLRPTHPDIDTILAGLVSKDPTVKKSLTTLDLGIKPAKGRSVPVLEVDKASQLTNWLWLGNEGENSPVEMRVGKDKLPGQGHFRTFIHSEQAQPAIIAINNKSLEIRLNDSIVFEQDSFWSGDQQVNVSLQPGLNVIEINLRKGRRAPKTMPPVFLYDPVGMALSGAKYLRTIDDLRSTTAEYDTFIAERGNVLYLQAAAELQFAPKQLSVTPGSKVRLVFSNPDIMMHNWVLLTPGSVDEIGSLADQLASQADGMEKGYLPESDKILVASKLLGPNAKEEIVFTAPSEPGDYPYICTFPGHWRIMQGTLTVAKKKTAKVPTEMKPVKSVTIPIGKGLLFETSSSPKGFKKLIPTKSSGKITANQKTNNDPIATLSDGKLGIGFGPIFANGIKNGAYKLDLEKPQDISAITSWAHQTGGSRGAQTVTLFGSNSPKDPGWDLGDKSSFTPLGTLSTKGQKLQNFTTLSRRAAKGKTLGNFRWIIWQVSPVTGADENTAFQELSVEIADTTTSSIPAEGKSDAHLFILSGQSNMARLDPDLSFTPAVTKAFGKDSVIVVKDAHGGQPIRRWYKNWESVQGKPGKNNGDLYDRLIGKVKAAIADRKIETVTFLWMQGENDAAVNQTGVYKKSLEGLLNQLRKDLQHDKIRFVIGRLSDYTLDTGKHSEWPQMRELQVAFADSHPLGSWVNTDDLNDMVDAKTGKTRNDVHYTKEGYRIFGERLADKAINLISAKEFPGIKSDFRGYVRYDKIKTEGGHFSIVCPKTPAPGKPWLWRSLFWEAIKKVSDADLKLVDEGYHVVLAHGDVAGHPSGNKNISAAYDYLTQNHGFAKTCSMSSMSRGTLSLFRWATENPEKVNSIYVDNGVCNVLSWPAGKLVSGNKSNANGAPDSWEGFKKKFGYKTDAEALKTKESPIDLLAPLAKHHVPILLVCGDKDPAVPYEENDAILEKRYKALGGPVKVIVEKKGHSHGMTDPTPVLEFIRKHTRATK